MPLSRVRLVSTLVVSGIGALLRHLFRTGYYPKEWPLKLSLIMGITKGMFGLLSFTTIEESQEMTCKDHTPAATKDAWLVEVAIPKNEDTAKDTLAVLNTALAKLDPDIKGLELNVDDVNNDLTAEWTAAKSEATLKGILFSAVDLNDQKPWTTFRCLTSSKNFQMIQRATL